MIGTYVAENCQAPRTYDSMAVVAKDSSYVASHEYMELAVYTHPSVYIQM